jgi:hypothetical protein
VQSARAQAASRKAARRRRSILARQAMAAHEASFPAIGRY